MPSQEQVLANDYSELSVVVPAYNEEAGIGMVLSSLCETLPGSQIIVVDDASTDGTAARVEEFPDVLLISHQFNTGYGGSIKTGLRAATREYVAWFDADNEHRADSLIEMFRLIKKQRLAAVLGQREKSVTSLRGVGKAVIWALARLLSVKSGTDLNCGLRVFRRDLIVRFIPFLPNGYSASLTSTIVLIEKNYPIRFHPISVNRRIGQSKVALSDGFKTMMLVLRIVSAFSPMRIYLPAGLVVFAIGVLYSLWVALRAGLGFPVLGGIVMVSGMLVVMLGLIADQLSQIRLTQVDNVEPRS